MALVTGTASMIQEEAEILLQLVTAAYWNYILLDLQLALSGNNESNSNCFYTNFVDDIANFRSMVDVADHFGEFSTSEKDQLDCLVKRLESYDILSSCSANVPLKLLSVIECSAFAWNSTNPRISFSFDNNPPLAVHQPSTHYQYSSIRSDNDAAIKLYLLTNANPFVLRANYSSYSNYGIVIQPGWISLLPAFSPHLFIS